MSANGPRGEAEVRIGGRTCRICLTLGALAEIETALGCGSMPELRARLASLSAGDLLAVLGALLRGGGEAETAARLGDLDLAPGTAARAVADAFEAALAREET